jgi:hypothetical protein
VRSGYRGLPYPACHRNELIFSAIDKNDSHRAEKRAEEDEAPVKEGFQLPGCRDYLPVIPQDWDY